MSRWTRRLDGADLPARADIGGKAWSIAHMQSLGLPVPAAFVITTAACRAFLADGEWPPGLAEEIADGVAWLQAQTGRCFGGASTPLLVSVRSGAAISMPGMMDTVLNLGMNDVAEEALGAECGDVAFARDSHRRFLHLYTEIVLRTAVPRLPAQESPAQWRETIHKACGTAVPQDAREQLMAAVQAVFESWNSRRARRYREHHGIAHDLGTAVTVQAMVFGNSDDRSGTGVLFSRNPLTGEPVPYGEYLARAQGEDVVSGRFTPKPLAEMERLVPDALRELLQAASLLERSNGEVQDIEFTVERGRLYLLQARAAKLAPQASVRTSVDLVTEGLIDRQAGLLRLAPERVSLLLAPRLAEGAEEEAEILAQGEGACPGVGIGVAVSDSDEAERRAADGEQVVLVRPTTSPDDLHGMIAACAVVTEEGGSTSHAAVVSRALGTPCVVGCGRSKLAGVEGMTITVDGQTGRVFSGAREIMVPDERGDPYLRTLIDWARPLSPLHVLRPEEAPSDGLLNLSAYGDAVDAERIGDVLRRLGDARGAQGGAIATPAGVCAAIEAKLDFIVTDPVLPALLAAVRAAAERPRQP